MSIEAASRPTTAPAAASPTRDAALEFPSINHMFRARATALGSRPSMYHRVGEAWVPITWAEYATGVDEIAGFLLSLGAAAQERFAILSYNMPQWHIADLGILHAGGVTVPIYFTNSAAQVEYILDHSQARVIFVENQPQLEKVLSIRRGLPTLTHIVSFSGSAAGEGVLTWEEARAAGRTWLDKSRHDLDGAWKAVKSEDVCTIIYTSGTTGPPKGVVMTHHNMLWALRALSQVLVGYETDSSVSYLPLAHIFEKIAGHMKQIYDGRPVYFAPSIDRLAESIQSVRPTFVVGVPRVWEKMYAQVRLALDHATGVRRAMAGWAINVGGRAVDLRQRGQAPGVVLRLQLSVAERLVLRTVRERLGLDRGRIFVSSAAPIAPDILRFYHAIGIPILEVYGATETTGAITVNPPDAIRIGTVGRSIPGQELRMADDGEIIVRGPHVFQGYYREPEQTSDVLQDGWYHTGDVGQLDADGYLRITDRKKDLIITAGGKNISPANIETALKRQGHISQAVAIGDKRPFMSALITLDPEQMEPWARENGIAAADPALLASDQRVRALIQEHVDRVNADLSNVERVKKFTILPRDFTVPDELTPTLKVKRKVVAEKYAAEIEAIYSDTGSAAG